MRRYACLGLGSLLLSTSTLLAQSPQPSPIDPTCTPAQRLQSAFGLFCLILLCYLIGIARNGRSSPIPWRALFWGIGLMAAFTAFVLHFSQILVAINDAIDALLGFTRAGAKLVFGDLSSLSLTVTNNGKPVGVVDHGAYFAFFVLPTIIFFSALTAVLYHIGVMGWVVQGIAWVMARSMRTSGAETLSSAANIFVGQTEAPLMIKPFLAAMTNSELMAVMVAGFANIASGVLGLYAFWLKPFVANAGGHLAAACFISAPAGLLVSKLLVPETQSPETLGTVRLHHGHTKGEKLDQNLIDAAARGTSEGLSLALNVAAMLIAFTALVAMINGLLGYASVHLTHALRGGDLASIQPLTLEQLLGYAFAPLAFLCGIPWEECPTVGSLLGVKTVLNELIAYSNMKELLTSNPNALSPRTALLTTYALCGFANFASVGIQVGGIASLAPERRKDLAKLGLLAMVGGGLTTLMCAAMVGVIK
jgi:CNT family concentrative nucleoside transporter